MKKPQFSEILAAILSELNALSTDIEASAIVSTDGLIMAAEIKTAIDEDIIAALSTAVMAQGDRTVRELGSGTLQQILVQGKKGYVVMTHAGRQAVLTILVKNSAKLGFIFLGVNKAAKKIELSGIAKPNTRMGLVYLDAKAP